MAKLSYYDQITEAVSFLKAKVKSVPALAVVLGTGLGQFKSAIEILQEVPYEVIPYFLKSTVASHEGKFIFGRLGTTPIIVLAGRFHYYEGYSMKEVTFPIRVLQLLGIKQLFLTNVAGGTNKDYQAGNLVVIKDHISFMPENPLRGQNDERLGPRFPDMKHTYSHELRNLAFTCAEKLDIDLREGVYFALPGPNLETPAEYAFIHNAGADLVGMSTVPEAIVAKHAGLNIFAISIVSNVCYPIEKITETTLEEVVEVAEKSGAKLSQLLSAMITYKDQKTKRE